jgi:fermentation-respiration switch protein FrsA (DUF1100 family)
MGIAVLFFLILGIVVAICCLYLFIIAVIPGMHVPSIPLTVTDKGEREGKILSLPAGKTVTFNVKNTAIDAWLYMPENRDAFLPCIVMAHGFGGTKDMGLDRYAQRFQEAGFAVFVFDYRYFGESGGQPRQLIRIEDQLEDWSAAVEYVRGRQEIDSNRIALWGTSLSGGHVIVQAARDSGIACVAAQCPAVDGRASAEALFRSLGVKMSLRMILHGQRDIVRSWLRLSPHMMPIVGKPGSMALLTVEGAYEALESMAAERFINLACARILLRADKYRPVEEAGTVRCPVLLQICDRDRITPLSASQKAAESLGTLAEVKHYPIGHFDIYSGEHFEKSVSDQIEFFKGRFLGTLPPFF